MGIISGAKSQMQRSLGLSCSNLEWVVSLLPVGGFIASITGGNKLIPSYQKNTNHCFIAIGPSLKKLKSFLINRYIGRSLWAQTNNHFKCSFIYGWSIYYYIFNTPLFCSFWSISPWIRSFIISNRRMHLHC